jgi:hypothetical protein
VLSCFRFCSPLYVLGISLLATAQSTTSASAPEYQFLAPLTTISSKVNEVNLAFTVNDHQGHFISNLRPDDFHLLDNQLTPPRFTFFQQRSDLPLHLAVFSLSTNTSELEPNSDGDAVLRQLAVSTGGTMLPAHDEARLSSSLRNVEKALRNQYVVAYSPPEFHADGRYHKVEVLPVKKGLRANCRKGYYASASIEAMKAQP